MDLRQLHYFVHIAQTRSMTQAASRVWVSQSALSRQMKLLEDELGVTLFERRARGVELTEIGQQLYVHATGLLKQVADVKHSLGENSLEAVGPLRLGAPTSLQNMLIAPFAVQFKAQHPKIQLSLREGTSRGMRDALGNGDCDAIVVSDLEQMQPFAVMPLVSEQLFWVGPVQARLSIDKAIDISQISTRPLILTAHPNSLRVVTERALAKQDLVAEPVAQADSFSMMLALIKRGMGYTVLPFSAVHEALLSRTVSASPIRGLRFNWVVAHSKERPSTTAVRLACQFLQELAAEQVAQKLWLTARLSGGRGRIATTTTSVD